MTTDQQTYSIAGKRELSSRAFIEILLARAVQQVNSGVSMTLTARRSSERPPRDSRHLTDTRTRVSNLLEYSLAYEMNHILQEDGQGYSVSSVLWNVFPDLIVRDAARENIFGLEVKALHTAAEEKSANFMTPIQIVRQRQDFIIIISWGWQTSAIQGAEITYPHIHAAGVFDAWLLAKIRDYGWLLNQAGRVKGVDLATPIINGQKGRFKAEEGNLGKLMRIQLPSDMPKSVPHYSDMAAEETHYAAFKQLVLALGLRETFRDVCALEGATVNSVTKPKGYPIDCTVLGKAIRKNGKPFILLAGNRPGHWLKGADLADIGDGAAFFWLSAKLNWRIYAKTLGAWKILAEGAKPDSEYEKTFESLQKL